MDARVDYIFNPQTLVSMVMFVFGLWAAWSSLNWKQKELERRIQKIEDLDLDNRLTRMEANLDWIRATLEKKL
jgi:hypothetical protein